MAVTKDRPLPSGRIALLLTDVEGSTAAWDRDPDGTDAHMTAHDAFVVATVEAHGGLVLKSKGEGDSTFSVFSRSAGAVAAALDLVRGLDAAGFPLAVRAAVHCGDVVPRAGDYFGPVPNRAARLRGLAPGGQVLVSSSVVREVGGELPPDAELVPLGSHELRGLAEPEEVFGLSHPDLSPVEQLVVARPPSNLPAPVDAFVGRDEERTLLEKALGQHRFVTIVGPGGVGKTRLALEAAADSAHARPGGTWFVDAGPLSSPDELAGAVVAAFGGQLAPGADPVSAAAAALTGTALLVLDTCEAHLGAAAELADALLLACDSLSVLATSREALRGRGEAVLRLAPLTAAPRGDGPSEAAQLFMVRARAADMTSSDELDATRVERVCEALDGIPLAIELAAARLGELDLEELEEQLSAAVGLDEAGDVRRSGPVRQRTLRATVLWSMNSLTAEERAVLARVTVFRGGWPRGAAEEVCADEGLPTRVVARAHAGLVSRSLVVPSLDTGASTRHRLLDAVRAIAAEDLDTELREVLADQHLAWASAAATALDKAASEGELPNWVAHFAAEMPNLHVAVERAVAVGDAAVAQSIAAATCNAWMERGAFAEARTALDAALNAGGGGEPRARALAASALACLFTGAYARAAGDIAEAIDIVRRDSDVSSLARAEVLGVAMMLAFQDGRHAEGRALSVEALEAARRSDDRQCLLIALNNRAVALPAQEHRERLRILQEAADLESELENAIYARISLAFTLGRDGRPGRGLVLLDAIERPENDAFARFSIGRARVNLELQLLSAEVAMETATGAVETATAARAEGLAIGLSDDLVGEVEVARGRALHRAGRSAEAIAVLDAVKGDEWRDTAELRSVEVLLDLEDLDAAESRLASVAEAEGEGDAMRLRVTAMVELARGRPDRALALVAPMRTRAHESGLGDSELELLVIERPALAALGRAAEAAEADARIEKLRVLARDST